jgi:hypothetical protein
MGSDPVVYSSSVREHMCKRGRTADFVLGIRMTHLQKMNVLGDTGCIVFELDDSLKNVNMSKQITKWKSK